jgi:flagellar assembly protein FliH
MAARFEFDLCFERAGERMGAGGATPPRCGETVAAPFEFPWLERSAETEAAEAGPAPPARTLSALELDAAVAAARAEATAATEASVRAELAASRDLAVALARALVPRALERQPLADIEAMLRDLLVRLEGQPRLTLALPSALVDDGRRTLAAIAAESGYRGELVVDPDLTLGAGDARLSWRGGCAERDLAELEREATALVDAWLPATAAEPPPTASDDASSNGAIR